MLSRRRLGQWFRTNRIPSQARDLVKRIRESSELHSSYCDQDPGRIYFSEKMGSCIRTTTHALYQTAVILLEHDLDVLEYWPLIPPDALMLTSKGRRFLREPISPYFFVIRSRSAGWEQFEFDGELERLSRAKPRSIRKVKGVWHQPEVERRASPLGLHSHVHSWSGEPLVHSNFVAPIEPQQQFPIFTMHSSQLVDSAVRPARVLAKIAIERFCARKNGWLVDDYSSGDPFADEDEPTEYLM